MNNYKKNFKTLSIVHDELRFLTYSEIRLEILKCLSKAPLTVKEIVEKTNMSYSSVSSNVNKLEKNNNIYKIDNKFKMTHLTKIYYESIINFNQSLEIITNFQEFWNKHNISNINYEAIQNLTDLYNSKLIKSTSVDIYKTYNTVKNQIKESDNIKAIFPYIHPEYPKLIEEKLEQGAKIELLVSKNIYKSLTSSINPEIKKENMKNGNLKIKSVRTPLNLYLTICDKEMSLGLYKTDDSFDQNRILISSNKNALTWSNKLFNEIKNQI